MWAIVESFKKSVGQGVLCTFIPFYSWYFAFSQYDGPDKGTMIALVPLCAAVQFISAFLLGFNGAEALVGGFATFSYYFLAPGTFIIFLVGLIASLINGPAAERK